MENIKIDLYIRETWSELWSCLDYPHPGPIYLPFFHMKSDGFWHIEYNEKAEQVNPKGSGELLQIGLNPSLSVVEVFTRDRIVAEEPAPTTNPGKDVTDCDFFGIEDFTASKPSHSTTPER